MSARPPRRKATHGPSQVRRVTVWWPCRICGRANPITAAACLKCGRQRHGKEALT